MVRLAISTPRPLPRQRNKGANDKSPQTNPTGNVIGDAQASGESIQMNDAPLTRCEFQIDEGVAPTRHAKPEPRTVNIDQLKRNATRQKKATGCTHAQALDQQAATYGHRNWAALIKASKTTTERGEAWTK